MTGFDIDQIGASVFAIKDREPSWAWAAKNINYRDAPNYDTPYRGRFDPELMPFWKEPLEMCHDRDAREIVVLKCSRAGYSENLLLTDLRYTIAREPEPTLYISGAMELVKGFLERRVIRGMKLAPELEKAFRQARTVATDIQFPAMDFRATWASSDTATKQDGWARIHCDEVSLWKEFTVDMVRRRAAAYPFHHIIFGGSIDPTRKGSPLEDPILKLYMESDKRVWMNCADGESFAWSLSGLKWSQDAKVEDEWNLEAVRESAYYETPLGQVVQEKDRMEAVRAGAWEVTQPGRARKGYKVVSPMIPFADCSFGELAARFISAKHRMNLTGRKEDRAHNTVRVYFAENWAEAHQDEEVALGDDALTHCEEDYEIGNVFVPQGWKSGVFATVDVQKTSFWWCARVWAVSDKGDVESSLLDYGNAASIADIDAKLADIKPAQVGIDISYQIRATEVADYCAEYVDRDAMNSAVMALRGSDSLKAIPIDSQVRDATEGRSRTGQAPYLELVWSVDYFRTWFIDTLKTGETWSVPRVWRNPREQMQYVKQVTSTKKVDGEWVGPTHRQDHLFDCEVMQFVLARWDNLI